MARIGDTSIELVSMTKAPYTGPGDEGKYIKVFRCLREDLDKLPVTDDMASGSYAVTLDTGDRAEFSCVTQRWYVWPSESVASLTARMNELEVNAIMGTASPSAQQA